MIRIMLRRLTNQLFAPEYAALSSSGMSSSFFAWNTRFVRGCPVLGSIIGSPLRLSFRTSTVSHRSAALHS
jgi:hypothetical protein